MGNGLTTEEEKTIAAVFAQVPAIERAVLFGSRAMGLARSNSDVDIALYGEKLGLPDILYTASLLEDTPLPYQFDLISYASITSPELLEHIRQYGKEMYRKMEKMNVIPFGWTITKLGNLGEVNRGRSRHRPRYAKELYGGPYPFIQTGDIKASNGRINSHTQTYNEKGLAQSRLWPKETMCITIAANIAETGILCYPACFPDSVIGFIANKNKCDVYFIEYMFRFLRRKLKNEATGSVQDNINLQTLERLEFLLPPLAEQKRIAQVLNSLDDKIENNKRINQHLEQMAFAIFDDMFPCVSNGEHTIGEYITPHRGKGLLSKDAIFGDVPVIAGGLTPATFHNVANTTAPVITISASGANSGFVALWNIPVWSSDSSFIDSSMTTDVFFWYTMLKKRQSEIYEAQTGSAQPHIYPKHIEIMPTIELTKDDVSTYTQRVTPLFEKMGANTAECLRLASLRDALLPRLMSGELSVADLDCAK